MASIRHHEVCLFIVITPTNRIRRDGGRYLSLKLLPCFSSHLNETSPFITEDIMSTMSTLLILMFYLINCFPSVSPGWLWGIHVCWVELVVALFTSCRCKYWWCCLWCPWWTHWIITIISSDNAATHSMIKAGSGRSSLNLSWKTTTKCVVH